MIHDHQNQCGEGSLQQKESSKILKDQLFFTAAGLFIEIGRYFLTKIIFLRP